MGKIVLPEKLMCPECGHVWPYDISQLDTCPKCGYSVNADKPVKVAKVYSINPEKKELVDDALELIEKHTPDIADDTDTTQPLLQCQCGFTTMLTDIMAEHIVDCMMAKSPKKKGGEE